MLVFLTLILVKSPWASASLLRLLFLVYMKLFGQMMFPFLLRAHWYSIARSENTLKMQPVTSLAPDCDLSLHLALTKEKECCF